MANFTFSGGTSSIGSTEWSLAFNLAYSAGSPKTSFNYVQAFVDVSNMVAGDSFRLRYYEQVNGGTQRIAHEATIQPQLQLYPGPLMLLGEGWDVTLLLVTGSARSFNFSTRLDTNDVNAATAGASAVTAIQSGLATAAALATLSTAVAGVAAAAAVNVWATVSEGSETAMGTLRNIASRLFGKATVPAGDGTYHFRDAADTKDRLVITLASTARTVSTRDGT